MKIEVGMLVRVISVTYEANSGDIGRIGVVDSTAFNHPDFGSELLYILEGETKKSNNGHLMGYRAENLEPINPDSEPADEDFQEDLKRWLDKKVTA